MTSDAKKLRRKLKSAAKKIAELERTLSDMGFVEVTVVVAEGEA
jgi:hypothetical protein